MTTENKAINFTTEQVQTLLNMQNELNTYIHVDWKEQGFDWNFAIIDECREIKEHLGWKWWKDNYNCGLTEKNKKQVQLEIIDILHFVLSAAGEREIEVRAFTRWLNNGNNYSFGDLQGTSSSMIRETAKSGADIPEIWNCLATLCDLTTETVMETYIQKYVLNKFRQDNGYKEGKYCKVWKLSTGVCDDQFEMLEDNQALEYALRYYTSAAGDEKEIYRLLSNMYESRLNK